MGKLVTLEICHIIQEVTVSRVTLSKIHSICQLNFHSSIIWIVPQILMSHCGCPTVPIMRVLKTYAHELLP